MRATRTISWILTFVAVGAAAFAWFTSAPDTDADLAVDVALGALESAGVDDAEVVGTPEPGVFAPRLEPAAGAEEARVGSEVPVWDVVVQLGDDRIEMKVDDADGQLVYVDDLIGEDRDERALSDEQWEQVEVYRDDHRGRWIRRNTLASVAAAVILGVGFTIARRGSELTSQS